MCPAFLGKDWERTGKNQAGGQGGPSPPCRPGSAGDRLVADTLGLGAFFAQALLLVGFVFLIVVEGKPQHFAVKED